MISLTIIVMIFIINGYYDGRDRNCIFKGELIIKKAGYKNNMQS